MRGSEEGIAETSSESQAVSEIESEGRGRCKCGEGFGLDGGKNELCVLMGVEVGGREHRSEDFEKVSPAEVQRTKKGETKD